MIEIEQMILRIPNITPEAGRQVSLQVAQRIADMLPSQSQDINIDQLNLQIRLSDNLSTSQLVGRISDTIVNRISRRQAMQSTAGFQHVNNTTQKDHKTNFLTSNDGSH